MRTRRYRHPSGSRPGGIARFAKTARFSPEEAQRRRVFFAECDAAYAEMQADPVLWAEEMAERRLWEATLLDGLEEE